MADGGTDPYAVLGVPRDASAAQIAQARRRLSRRLHPDVNRAPDAEARFEAVQEAYELLSDPAARAAYDRAPGRPGTRPPGGRRGPAAGRAAGAGPGRGGADGQAAEVAPGLYVQPGEVDFGSLHPGRPWAYAKVTVAWTGQRPARITSTVRGGWWRQLHSESPASGSIVFSLRAERELGGPVGPQDGQFTVTLDSRRVQVRLRANFLAAAPGARAARRETGRRALGSWLRRTR